MGQIEQFDHLTVCKQMTELLILHIIIWNHLNVQTNE